MGNGSSNPNPVMAGVEHIDDQKYSNKNAAQQSEPTINTMSNAGERDSQADSTVNMNSVVPGVPEVVSLSGKPRNTNEKPETALGIFTEMSIPFFTAGLAMVAAGILLEQFIRYPVFTNIKEMIILTTPLLGLKGDLEMTLGCRLCSQVHMGNFENKKLRNKICFANLCLDQQHAIACGAISVVVAVLLSIFVHGSQIGDPHLGVWHSLLIMFAAGVCTGSICSVFLGSVMVSVVVITHKYNWNPDNVAAPIAGSLGDVMTLCALTFISQFLYDQRVNHIWISYFILTIFFTIVAPLCFMVAYRCDQTRYVLKEGWLPIIISVILSAFGGLFLEQSSSKTAGVAALYQPLISGIGGNLVSVQGSRVSSQYHRDYQPGVLPEGVTVCESPIHAFFDKNINAVSARLLLFLTIPGHLMFTAVAHYSSVALHTTETKPGPCYTVYGAVFVVLFIFAALVQVTLLLYIAKVMINICWKRKLDPDTTTIPYLTAFGDLFGSAFLFIAFQIYFAAYKC